MTVAAVTAETTKTPASAGAGGASEAVPQAAGSEQAAAVPARPTPEQVREAKLKQEAAEWEAAKETAAKAKGKVVNRDDGSVGTEDEEGAGDEATEAAVEADADGETPAEGEKPVEGEKPAEGEKPDETKPPSHKDWKKFRAWEHDAKKQLSKREEKIVERERSVNDLIARAQAEVGDKLKAAEARIASVKGLDSDDPYEVWAALSKWKGWDTKESFNTVTQRTLHGGEKTLQEQLTATEKRLQAELAKRDEDIKKEREERDRERKLREQAEMQQHNERIEASARTAIANDLKKLFEDPQRFRFLKRYTPEQAAHQAYADLKRHYLATSKKDSKGDAVPGTGEEISLAIYFDRWESLLKQEYEALRGLDPESSRTSSEGPGTGHGNGAAVAANPGTQQGNSAQQRKTPSTVTRNLTTQRSENGRQLSPAEEWEEAKRVGKQRASASR